MLERKNVILDRMEAADKNTAEDNNCAYYHYYDNCYQNRKQTSETSAVIIIMPHHTFSLFVHHMISFLFEFMKQVAELFRNAFLAAGFVEQIVAAGSRNILSDEFTNTRQFIFI